MPFAEDDTLNEIFTPDPAWSKAGSCTTNTGELVTTQNGGGDYADSPLFTIRTEYWLGYDLRYELGGTFKLSSSHNSLGGGLFDSGNNDCLILGLKATAEDDESAEFRVSHRDDAGRNTIDTGIPVPFAENLRVVMHWKAASAPLANDGIAQVWVIRADNSILTILDLSNVDSDTLTARNFRGNSFSSNSGQSLVSRVDNIQMGIAGSGPA